MARRKATESDAMEDDAARIRMRRERLGATKAELAREAGVSRTTVNAIESGEGFQRSTYGKLERALSAMEEEAGMNAPPPPPAEEDRLQIEVELPDGRKVRVTTRGSASAEQVAEQVAAILARMAPE